VADVDIVGGTEGAPGADAAGGQGGADAAAANQKKQKEKMECGESGKYGDLKKKTGGGLFDRDHVPSKAALKEFARRELNAGKELCDNQKKAINNVGNAIAIPKEVHSEHSPSYGGRNTPQHIEDDSKNLQQAAKNDTEKVSQGMKDPCKKKYDEWAKKTTSMTNDDYAKMLKGAMGK
jgi:hypothetical protein